MEVQEQKLQLMEASEICSRDMTHFLPHVSKRLADPESSRASQCLALLRRSPTSRVLAPSTDSSAEKPPGVAVLWEPLTWSPLSITD